MNPWNFTFRNRIGIAAGILLTIATITYGLHYLVPMVSVQPQAACMRIGSTLFFLWLAWPDLATFPRWVLHASLPIAILSAIYPGLLCFIIPTVLLMLYLQPKPSKSKKKK